MAQGDGFIGVATKEAQMNCPTCERPTSFSTRSRIIRENLEAEREQFETLLQSLEDNEIESVRQWLRGAIKTIERNASVEPR